MLRAATSIVLIFGQLALLVAAPVYICTSADGTQRLEWGECECSENDGHFAPPRPEWQAAAAPACEQQLAAGPCHCEHQPLSDDVRLISRSEPVTRGAATIAPAGDCGLLGCQNSAKLPLLVDANPRGHTPLSDRLSICLRC